MSYPVPQDDKPVSESLFDGPDGQVDGPERNEQQEKSEGTDRDPEKQFLVEWDDGDNDPENPRSIAIGRKWLITFVVAFSSLCVLVGLYLLPRPD